MKFADKLTILRKTNNLSQEQLAEKIGVSRQAVSKWESGDSYPDMAKIIGLCKILNCKLNELLDDGLIDEEEVNKTEFEKKENTINKYLNNFLEYVTKSCKMFFSLNTKQKIQMIIELCILAFILWLFIDLLDNGIIGILSRVVYLIPSTLDAYFYRIIGSSVDTYLYEILELIALIGEMLLGFIVFFHIFKIRYLDPYDAGTINEELVEKKIVKEDKKTKKEIDDEKQVESLPIVYKEKKKRNLFIDGIVKIVVFIIKFNLVIIEICLVGCTIFVVGAMIFCLFKGGDILVSISIALLGVLIFSLFLVLLIYNYLFNRKQPHKLFVWMVVVSLLLSGMGLGYFGDKILGIKQIDPSEGLNMKQSIFTLPSLNENDVVYLPSYDVEYVIDEDKKDITIEIEHPIGYEIRQNIFEEGADATEYYYSIRGELNDIKLIIDDISNGKIRDNYDYYEMTRVKVICNSKNAEKFAKLGY